MSSESQTANKTHPGALVRAYRDRQRLSLDELAALIKKAGAHRPSIAKLSRIETGVQDVPLDILEALSSVTGTNASLLRPDLAKLFTPSRARPRRTRVAA